MPLSFNPSPTGVPLFQRVPPSFYDPSTYRGDFFHRGTRFKLFLGASFLRVEFKIDFRSLLEYFDRFAVIVLSTIINRYVVKYTWLIISKSFLRYL